MKPAPPKTRRSRLGDLTTSNSDGTRGLPTGQLVTLASGTDVVDAPTSFGPEMAAKLAVVDLLRNFAAHDVQWKQVVTGTAQPAQVIHLRSGAVILNWPEQGVIEAPLKMTVQEQGEFDYDDLGLSGPNMLDETLDKFGVGTVLMHEADVTGTVAIDLVVASSSIRDAVRLALRRLFAMEPNDTRTGRRVVLSSYYDSDVRVSLARRPFQTDNTPSEIQAGRYGLTCLLDIDVPAVRLVASPGVFETNPAPAIE